MVQVQLALYLSTHQEPMYTEGYNIAATRAFVVGCQSICRSLTWGSLPNLMPEQLLSGFGTDLMYLVSYLSPESSLFKAAFCQATQANRL